MIAAFNCISISNGRIKALPLTDIRIKYFGLNYGETDGGFTESKVVGLFCETRL